MSKLAKILLTVTAVNLVAGILFVTGVIPVGYMVSWYITFPTGVIFLGLFIISYMLRKEVARFDQEQRSQPAAPRSEKPAQSSRTEVEHGCHAEPQRAH
jgi:hypothetical protein